MKTRLLLSVLLSLMLIISISCSPSNSQPSASAAQQAAASPAQSAAVTSKTLKIGVIAWLGVSSGVDMVQGLELMTGIDNKNGGLDIGGEKYKVELVTYDSNMNQATEVAAANKLIFEDKVKFILGEADVFLPAWLKIADDNKVIVVALGVDVATCMSPNYHYIFNGDFTNGAIPSVTGWLCKNYPDMVKDIIQAFPDSQGGHFGAEQTNAIWKSFGVTPTSIFYPSSANDLSSMGTKVTELNPGAFMAVAGGPTSDALALKAVHQAGYKGQMFATSGTAYQSLIQLFSADLLEGFINGAWAVEFDPAANNQAQEFKDAWIAKYGTWEGVDPGGSSQYACLRTALQQANSLDANKIAAVLGNGMKFEGPGGIGQMISRPDYKNERTVDSITTYYIKKIQGGKPTLLATIGMDEAMTYFQKMMQNVRPAPAMPASGPPSGGPPSNAPQSSP